jgi:hypothetical protein
VRYLVPALVSEGPTDIRLLEPLILRALEERLATAPRLVEIQVPFLDLAPVNRSNDAVLVAAQHKVDAFDLLFVHTDGKGNPEGARAARVTPIARAIGAAACGRSIGCVGVVPVHETEAWALSDGDAIRAVFGTTKSDLELGLPGTPRAIEACTDPKAVLLRVYVTALGGRKRHRPGKPVPLRLLGERIALDRLRLLANFRIFESELAQSLRQLGFDG